MVRRNCKVCGEFYYVKYKSIKRKTCSKRCRYSLAGSNSKTGDNRKCMGCGGKFYAPQWKIDKGEAKYCSKRCAWENYSKPKKGACIECKTCGGKVYKTNGQIEEGAKYCSKECYHEDTKRVIATKKCPICDSEFNSNTKKKYCSRECQHKSMRNRKTIDCDGCGQEIKKRVSSINDTLNFCSKECFIKNNHIVNYNKSKKGDYIKCHSCDAIVYKEPNKIVRNSKSFCSRECYDSYQNMYPNTIKLRKVVRRRWEIENLNNHYIKHLLTSRSELRFKDIPNDLIELKRLNVRRKRIISNQKK